MSTITHFFIPADELDEHELTEAIAGPLATLLCDLHGLHLLGEALHFLDELGSLQMNPRPSAVEVSCARRYALSTGALAATPLGDRRGIWVPIDWVPEPVVHMLDGDLSAPRKTPAPPAPVARPRAAAATPSVSASIPSLRRLRSPWPSLRPLRPW